jgi:L-asparaginase / beta-aspartyl-peptidase
MTSAPVRETLLCRSGSKTVIALAGALALAGLLALAPADGAGAAPAPAPAGHPGWAIAIHGGAGTIPHDMDAATKRVYLTALETALGRGSETLAAGGSALDAVQKVLLYLEDDPNFNASKGAVFTHEGTHELDAAIMDGATLNAGAVAAVRTVRHPIALARLVMERSPHVLLVGDGAEAFATEMGVERVENSWFDTPRRRLQLEEALEKERRERKPGEGEKEKGTVGAVALDQAGHLAAATSTGGLTNKRFGRVGDSPIVGAGTYADDRSCAISGTGTGEQFIRHTVARSIAARMQFLGEPLEQAEKAVIGELAPGDGGVIGVAHDGSIAFVFNSEAMLRGAADSSGRFELGIWDTMSPVAGDKATPP